MYITSRLNVKTPNIGNVPDTRCTCYLQMSHNKILIGNDFILLVIVKALNY